MGDIIIRAAEMSDIDALTELANLPGVRHGTARLPFTTKSFIENRMKSQSGVPVLVATSDQWAIGQAFLVCHTGRRSHAGELGLYVHDDHIGKGVGTKLLHAVLDFADNWLGLRRIELTVNVDNQRAIRLYERLGFQKEGVRRADILRNGTLVDSFMMARLKEAPHFSQ